LQKDLATHFSVEEVRKYTFEKPATAVTLKYTQGHRNCRYFKGIYYFLVMHNSDFAHVARGRGSVRF